MDSGIDAVVGPEEPVQAREGQQPEYLWSRSRQREHRARGLGAPVSVHQDGHAGGVAVGDSGQIEDQPGAGLARGIIEIGAQLGPGVIVELAGHLTGVGYLDSAGINALFAHASRIQLIASPLLAPVLTVSGLSDITSVQEPQD